MSVPFLVNVDDTHEYVSDYSTAKWIIHPPEPYKAAKLNARQMANVSVDMVGVDPDSPDYTAEFIKRSTLKDPDLPTDIQYEWVMLGLSEIVGPDGESIDDFDLDFLHKRVPFEAIRDVANEIAGLATVDAVTEKNLGSPSASKD